MSFHNFASHKIAFASRKTIFFQIFLFDDTEDRATLLGINNNDIQTINTNSFNWTRDMYEATENQVVLQLSGRNETFMGEDGVIRVNVSILSDFEEISTKKFLLYSTVDMLWKPRS